MSRCAFSNNCSRSSGRLPSTASPRFFGGALGYVAYDAVEHFHRIANAKRDPHGLPEIFFIFVQTLVAFDNLKHTIKVIDNVRVGDGKNLRQKYNAAAARIRRLVASVEKTARKTASREIAAPAREKKFQSNLTPRAFKDAVGRAKEYIRAGDIIQAVLCQRLETTTEADPFEIYRALRLINPSPYMYYLEMEGLRVIGSSPETMVRLTGDTIELRPIAGTRRRGATPEEERALEAIFWPIPRNAPSTSCSSTWAATTSDASPPSGPSKSTS
jgi:anthranilate synthase component 1